MSQTAARQEVENFYFMINQWKETRTLIENHLHSFNSESKNLEVLQELDKMEETFKYTPEWTRCRTLSDVRLAIIGTEESRKSLLIMQYLYGTLDVEIPKEDEVRHKKDFYMEGRNQLLLIREVTGAPSKQLAQWADTVMFVFSLENPESFNSIYKNYHLMDELRSKSGLDSLPSLLVGIHDNSHPRLVSHSAAMELATEHMDNSPYIEVVPELGVNVEASFHRACEPISGLSFQHWSYRMHSTHSSLNKTLTINGDDSLKLVRQSSLPISTERSSHKRKKVAKKYSHVKSNFEVSDGVPLLGTGRDIPIKESKIMKRGNKRKKDWKKKFLVLTQDSVTYYPSAHDYMDQINGKSINLLHCTVKIPGKDPTGITRSNSILHKNGDTFPRYYRTHSISEGSPKRKRNHIFTDLDQNIGFMSDGAFTDMSDDEDTIFSASAVFSKPASFVNPLFTQNPVSPIDDSVINRLFRRREPYSEPEDEPNGPINLHSSIDAKISVRKKKTPRKLQTYLKTGHVRGKSDLSSVRFAATSTPENNTYSFEFHIISLDGKLWVFDAGSTEEQESWIKLIEQQIQAALITSTGDKTSVRPSSVVDSSQVARIRNANGNEVCCDCLAPEPEWASVNLGTVICVHCSSVHRQMGTHVSRIKSLELDDWTTHQLDLALSLGNDLAREVWEATSQINGIQPPDHSSCTRKERESWIRMKYQEKAFLKPLLKDALCLQQTFYSAVEREDIGEVYSLLPYCSPTELNHQDPLTRRSALHVSVIADNHCLTLLLIWNHADPSLQDAGGKRAIDYSQNSLRDLISQLTNTYPANPVKSHSSDNLII